MRISEQAGKTIARSMPWTLVFTLVVFAPLTGINVYVGRTLYRALIELTAWKPKVLRRVMIVLLIFVNLLPVVFLSAYLTLGRVAVPAFAGDVAAIDYFLTYPFWIALVISVQLVVLFGLMDIAAFMLKRWAPTMKTSWDRRIPAAIVLVACAVSLYTFIVIARDTWTVRIVERDVALPQDLKSLSGFRIAQISDVQGDGRTTPEILRRYVKQVNSQKPDLVLFAGDLVTSGTAYIDSSASVLGGLEARYGSIAAIGDHDIFSRKSMILDALHRAGIRVAEDTTLSIAVDSGRIAVTVVTYTYSQRPTNDRLQQILRTSDGAFDIVLVHQPAEVIADLAASRGYRLLVAGHTHGGGIAIGIPGVFLLAPANAESRYVSGLYRVHEMVVSVTNGLGFTLAPIRYHAPAEIVMITLR